MGLADGDLYVTGSILSFQQMKRIYQNFRAASVPSNLQPGALWSDSDDDKIHHRGASAIEEIMQLTRSADVSPQFATIRLMDAGADHYLDIRSTEELTGNKILTILPGDTNRTITLEGNPTLDDWFDQGLKVADKPTHAGGIFTKTINWKKGADKASAATLDISALDGNYFDVTGTTDITAISTSGQIGTIIKLHFDGILTIVHDGDNIVLPGGKDIYTIAETELEFTEYDTGKWRCTTYLKAQPVLTNLLPNSGFGYWSQSDDNEGLCTLAYKTGAKGAGGAPSVGDACVGANGATGKVISYTIASGTWNAGDADGVLTLGACTGSWTVDEVLTFAGVETAAVKSEAVGICNDPCNNDGTGDWTDADAILSFDIDHYEIASDAVNEKTYITSLTFTKGKIYKVEAKLKDGTATPTDIELVSLDGAVVEKASKPINTTGNFVTYFLTFEATSGTDGVGIITPTSLAGNNIEMKYFICYEITPCCTGADMKAFDGWYKDPTLDIYRHHKDATYTKEGGFYSLKYVPTAVDDYLTFPSPDATAILEEWKSIFANRIVAVGMWVLTSTAAHFNFGIYDGTGNTQSSFHSGGGTWEWIEVTRVNAAAPTQFFIQFNFVQAPNINGSTIVYISQPMLVFGSSIGKGNYAPKPQEWIYGEKFIPSNKYDNTTSLSDAVYAVLNLEADSNGKIPKGIKAAFIHIEATDTGSGAVTDLHVHCRKDSTASRFFTLCFAGKLNNAEAHAGGIQPCNSDGDIEVELEASGVGTLSITRFRFLGVQVN